MPGSIDTYVAGRTCADILANPSFAWYMVTRCDFKSSLNNTNDHTLTIVANTWCRHIAKLRPVSIIHVNWSEGVSEVVTSCFLCNDAIVIRAALYTLCIFPSMSIPCPVCHAQQNVHTWKGGVAEYVPARVSCVACACGFALSCSAQLVLPLHTLLIMV